MLFASAGFLFAFLPVFLLIFMIVPNRAKKAVVLIGSVAFYVIANIYEPFSIAVLWLVILFHYFAAFLLRRFRDRFLLILFILVDVMAFFSLRLLCNQMMDQYYFAFPIGASLYLLMGVSYLIDLYREPELCPDDLVRTALYLSFFPIMLAGPLIRFREFCDHMDRLSFRVENFSRGARILTVGLVKVLGVGAVLVEAYESILQFEELQVNLAIGLLSLVMMYLIVFFSFSGYSDMGVGLCVMLGLPIRRDYNNPLTATSTMRYLKGFFGSFYAFIDAYIIAPLEKTSFATPRVRRAVGLSAYVLALTLWFRVDMRALLIALPLLIAVLVEELTPVGKLFRRRGGKVFGWLLTLVVTVVYWAQYQWGSYAEFFEYLHTLTAVSGSYQSLYTYATSIGSDFIIVALIALVILMPLSYMDMESKVGDRVIPAKVRIVVDVGISLMLMALLFLTLVYFMPQFPQYAIDPYAYFVI